MGVFADLFRRDQLHSSSSRTSTKRQPLSTLDIPLPQPRPAGWGPRTPASLPPARSRFGPRDPYNVYDPPAAHDYPPHHGPPSTPHAPHDRTSLDDDFAALRLSTGPPAGAPRLPTPSVPPPHERPGLPHASASAPTIYPPAALAGRPPAPHPPVAAHSLSTPPPTYSAYLDSPPTVPQRPSPANARPPAPPPRPSPRPPAAGPSSGRQQAPSAQAKAWKSRRRPAPAPLLPRSASAPSSATSSSDGTYRDFSLSSSPSPTSGAASDDSLPHPSSLGSTARSPQPRTPGSARRSSAAPDSATPRARRAGASPTPRKGSASPSKRVSSSAAAAQQQQQCAALTARSTRCTRLVRTADPALAPGPALGQGEVAVEEDVPAYCAQHAKGKLVESGCFVRARRTSGGAAAAAGAAGAEQWARFAGASLVHLNVLEGEAHALRALLQTGSPRTCRTRPRRSCATTWRSPSPAATVTGASRSRRSFCAHP